MIFMSGVSGCEARNCDGLPGHLLNQFLSKTDPPVRATSPSPQVLRLWLTNGGRFRGIDSFQDQQILVLYPYPDPRRRCVAMLFHWAEYKHSGAILFFHGDVPTRLRDHAIHRRNFRLPTLPMSPSMSDAEQLPSHSAIAACDAADRSGRDESPGGSPTREQMSQDAHANGAFSTKHHH